MRIPFRQGGIGAEHLEILLVNMGWHAGISVIDGPFERVSPSCADEALDAIQDEQVARFKELGGSPPV